MLTMVDLLAPPKAEGPRGHLPLHPVDPVHTAPNTQCWMKPSPEGARLNACVPRAHSFVLQGDTELD